MSSSPLLVGLLLSLSLLVLLYIVNTLRIAYRPALRNIPGPGIARFTRLYHAYIGWSGKLHEKCQELHAKHGPIVRTGPNHVLVSDPEIIPLVFGISSKFLKTDFYKPFDMLLDGKPLPSMFSERDPAGHKHLKTPVAGIFSLSSIRQLEPLVDEATDIFVDAMTKLSPQPVDFGAWLQWYAFDVIGSMTFLGRFGFMEKATDVNDMIANIEGGLFYMSIICFLPELHSWLLGNYWLMRLLSLIPAVRAKDPFPNILNVTKREIAAYDQEQRNSARGDLLASIRQQRAKDEARMGDRDLISHLTNNLLAGSDTTAISLRAIFYYLLKNPAAHAKLIQEIETAEQNGNVSPTITLAEGLKLPYLQAVIKEAVRMHPGVGSPLWRRVPSGGATICGRAIPEGVEVGMNAWAVHQDRRVFGDDAKVFRPERWVEASEEKTKAMDRAFFSFGSGARTCIGKNISIMEMCKFVPEILRRFDLEWAGPNEEWVVETRWFSRQGGMNVILRPKGKTHKSLEAVP